MNLACMIKGEGLLTTNEIHQISNLNLFKTCTHFPKNYHLQYSDSTELSKIQNSFHRYCYIVIFCKICVWCGFLTDFHNFHGPLTVIWKQGIHDIYSCTLNSSPLNWFVGKKLVHCVLDIQLRAILHKMLKISISKMCLKNLYLRL